MVQFSGARSSGLTILPGTRLHFLPGSKLTVFGALRAEGTLTDTISFMGIGYNDSTWFGVHINTVDSANLSYVVIEGAENGIYLQSPEYASITSSRISYCTNAVTFDKCCTKKAQLSNCELSNNKTGVVGIISNGSITNNLIHDNSNSGVFWQWDYPYCEDGAAPRFEANEISTNGWDGMNDGFSLWGTNAELVCNDVRNNYPSQVANYDNGSPQLGEFSSTGLGRNLFDATNSTKPVISIFSGDMIYKAGDNGSAADEPNLFGYSESTVQHTFSNNYWSKEDTTRFEPPSLFTVNPMYELPAPTCTGPSTSASGDRRTISVLDGGHELYLIMRNAVLEDSIGYAFIVDSLFSIVIVI